VGAAAALLVGLGPGGIITAVVLAVLAITGIFLWSRRSRVDHRNLHQPEPGVFVRPKKKRKARR
jgi:hypothetical protein